MASFCCSATALLVSVCTLKCTMRPDRSLTSVLVDVTDLLPLWNRLRRFCAARCACARAMTLTVAPGLGGLRGTPLYDRSVMISSPSMFSSMRPDSRI